MVWLIKYKLMKTVNCKNWFKKSIKNIDEKC